MTADHLLRFGYGRRPRGRKPRRRHRSHDEAAQRVGDAVEEHLRARLLLARTSSNRPLPPAARDRRGRRVAELPGNAGSRARGNASGTSRGGGRRARTPVRIRPCRRCPRERPGPPPPASSLTRLRDAMRRPRAAPAALHPRGRSSSASPSASGFAAVNTGNNLLYLVLGSLLSLVILPGAFSEIALPGGLSFAGACRGAHCGPLASLIEMEVLTASATRRATPSRWRDRIEGPPHRQALLLPPR